MIRKYVLISNQFDLQLTPNQWASTTDTKFNSVINKAARCMSWCGLPDSHLFYSGVTTTTSKTVLQQDLHRIVINVQMRFFGSHFDKLRPGKFSYFCPNLNNCCLIDSNIRNDADILEAVHVTALLTFKSLIAVARRISKC